MTSTEEMETLAQLQSRPPEWLLYLELTPKEFLRVFPHGSGLNWRFDTLEAWMRSNYRVVDDPGVNVAVGLPALAAEFVRRSINALY